MSNFNGESWRTEPDGIANGVQTVGIRNENNNLIAEVYCDVKGWRKNSRIIASGNDLFEWAKTMVEMDQACEPISGTGMKRLRKLVRYVETGR